MFANSPEDDSAEDSWTGKVEINVEVRVKMIVFELRLYFPTLFTATISTSNFFTTQYSLIISFTGLCK